MEVINNVKMSLSFNLRAPKKMDTQRIVYCVIKLDDRQIKVPIDCKVYGFQWNKKMQMCAVNNTMMAEQRENNISVNKKIFDIKCNYMEFISYLCENEMEMEEIENKLKENINNIVMANNTNNLRKSVTRTKKATNLLKKAFEIYCGEIKPNLSEGSKSSYQRNLNRFFKYCEEIGEDKESMLTQKGVNDYQSYLLNSQNAPSNKQINNYVRIIKMMVNDVIMVHNDFIKEQKTLKEIKVITLEENKINDIEDKLRRPLTDEELNKIKNCQLDERLNEYRDLFVLQCLCGYRVSDTAKLFDESSYKNTIINGKTFIEITPQKEHKKGVKAIIFVNDEIKAILNKYCNGFKFVNIFSPTYRGTYNNNLKKIAKKAGLCSVEKYVNAKGEKCESLLCDIISSHFARYTFVNRCFEMGMTAEQIIMFSGHKDVDMIKEVYGLRNSEQRFAMANDVISQLTEPTNENYGENILSEKKRMLSVIDALKFTFMHIGVTSQIIKMDKAEQILLYSVRNFKKLFDMFGIDIESCYLEYLNKTKFNDKVEFLENAVEDFQMRFGII